MKKVIKYQTSDGILHDSYVSAMNYADNRYGNKLTDLTARILHVNKYEPMYKFIDANLREFAELIALKEDGVLDKEEDEEDNG